MSGKLCPPMTCICKLSEIFQCLRHDMQSHWNSHAPRKDTDFAEWCYYSQRTSLGWLPLWFSWYPVPCTSLNKQQKSCPLYQTRSFFFPPSYQQNPHSLNPTMPKSRSFFFFFSLLLEANTPLSWTRNSKSVYPLHAEGWYISVRTKN